MRWSWNSPLALSLPMMHETPFQHRACHLLHPLDGDKAGLWASLPGAPLVNEVKDLVDELLALHSILHALTSGHMHVKRNYQDCNLSMKRQTSGALFSAQAWQA